MASLALTLPACGGGSKSSEPEPAPPSPLSAPTLSFTAPGRSLDLANYTLTARVDLPQGTGANLLAAEASAVTYDKDTDTLFVVGDGGTAVVQVTKTGQLIDSMTLARDPTKPQGTYFYDVEGLAYIGNGQFVFTEETFRQVDRFTYAANTTLGASGARTVKLGTELDPGHTGNDNVGLEGLSYDPMTAGFILGKERNPLGIFQTDIDFAAGTASNGSATTENAANLFDPALAGVLDVSDIYALANTVPSTAADYGDLLVLSKFSGKVVEVDRSGRVFGSLNVGITFQHEGLTVDQNRILYLVNEMGGGRDHAQLWVYTPTTGSAAVGVGSKLVLAFDEPVVAGVGNLTLSNNAGDSRSIAITDTSQINIDGASIVIDPSADLIAGSTYTVQAPAGLLRAASGDRASPAASLSFTTVVQRPDA